MGIKDGTYEAPDIYDDINDFIREYSCDKMKNLRQTKEWILHIMVKLIIFVDILWRMKN